MITNMIMVISKASVKNYWKHHKDKAALNNYVTPDFQFMFLIGSKIKHISQHKIEFL